MKIEPEKSVFINCPYDPGYASLFEAIIFATVCCGFVPRSAIESGTVAEPRMDRIVRTLFESQYSIHDLSRSRGEGEEGFARFNMPLELGIAMARRYMTRDAKQPHDWLVLIPAGHHHHRFISDLSGFDPAHHDGTDETLVPRVMFWLTSRLNAIPSPDPWQVLEALPKFRFRRKELGIRWAGEVPWRRVLDAAEEMAPKF
jgi:hypothetical protein